MTATAGKVVGKVVGKGVRQLRWDRITRGTEQYASDVPVDGALVGLVLRSPHSHARIVRIDTAAARAMPGVQAVVTADDLGPDVRYIHHGGPMVDRPPFARGVVRFIGQEVAAVAAETSDQAKAALAAITVEYELLPGPLEPADALAAETGLHDRPSGVANLSSRLERTWGDVDGARAAEAAVVTGRFSYPKVSHACMEPNTTLARWDDERGLLELWTSTQAPHFIVKEVAHALDLDESKVVCREVAVGGGFGSKSKISEHEVPAALLARAARRPVLLALTREEEFGTTKTRHRFDVELRLSADADGRLCLVDATVDVENGAYNHSGPSVLSSGVRSFGTLYEPMAVHVTGRLIDTAKQPGGQFRGYGNPQVSFAMESLVDDMARQLGIDPFELRIRNANQPDSEALNGARFGTARLADCLRRLREEIGWDAKQADRRPGRGIGIAAAVQGSGYYTYAGSNTAEATVSLHDDGRVVVFFGGADAGTGQRTILAQLAADALGVDLADVDVVMMDSETTPFDMGAWSSRGTQMGGHSTLLAAEQLGDRLRALAVDKLGGSSATLDGGRAVSDNGASVALGELVGAASDAVDGALTVTAEYEVPGVEMPGPDKIRFNMSASYTFAAHAAEVEVDERTGEVKVLDYVAVHDSGRILNPTFAEGQVVGAVVMGLGAALGEELLYEGGRLVNPAYINYAMPRAADAPNVRVVFIDGHEPKGPMGAKSVGELPIAPPGAVIANAVRDAVGVRIHHLPITPDKVLAAVRDRRPTPVVRVRSVGRRPRRWWVAGIRWAYPRGFHRLLHRHGTRLARRAPAVPPVADIVSPTDLPSVAAELSRGGDGTTLLAGGTDLLLQRRQGLTSPVRFVSLHDVQDLARIDLGAGPSDPLTIGAGVTLTQLVDELGPVVPILAEAAATIASTQIRNVATVGGNLLQAKRCWFFRNGFDCYKRGGATCPCYAVLGDHRFYHAAVGAHRCQAVTPSDLATALVALDAEVVLRRGAGERRVAVEHLYTGPGETGLADDEVLVSVVIPASARRRRGTFEKLRLWQGDFAVVAAAVTVVHDGDRWTSPRVVLGAIAPEPLRLVDTERAVQRAVERSATGGSATARRVAEAAADELGRLGHPLERNGWKLDAAVGLTERAVERLVAQSAGATPVVQPAPSRGGP